MQDVLAWLREIRGNYLAGLKLLQLHFPDAPELGVLAKMDTVANRKVLESIFINLFNRNKLSKS